MLVETDTIIDYAKNLQILYVEDDPDIQESTIIILEIFFEKVITASNGLEGIEKFKNHTIDIIITDINMPFMNGLDMAKEIKKINMNVPILISSAYNDTNYFLEAITIGVEGYLLKPLDLEQFKQGLYKAINAIRIQREHKLYQDKLKNRLVQKSKILLEQSKLVAMGEMIDIIAHQWKQPLNSIVMHASMIENSLESMDKEALQNEFQECYSNLNMQIDHLLETLNEFRTFFRPNNTLEVVSIQSIIDSTLVLLKDELLSHQIQIHVECDPKLSLKVYPNDIKQLFINIIINAKEAMVNNNVASNQREIFIKCYKQNSHIILQIKNSGSSIDESIIENIFNMNFTTKQESGGTGIGLYMCSLICEKYNAEIKAYNDDGVVFEITF